MEWYRANTAVHHDRCLNPRIAALLNTREVAISVVRASCQALQSNGAVAHVRGGAKCGQRSGYDVSQRLQYTVLCKPCGRIFRCIIREKAN